MQALEVLEGVQFVADDRVRMRVDKRADLETGFTTRTILAVPVLRPPSLAEGLVSCAEIDDGRSWTEHTGHSKLACARHWRATSLAVAQRRRSMIYCRIRRCKLRDMAWHLHGDARACAGGGPAL